MIENLRLFGVGLVVTLSASLSAGCAQVPHFVTALGGSALELEAWGPGTVFPTIEAAAIDALTYAYLQGLESGDTELVRGGTIYFVDEGYTYGEVRVAGPFSAHRIRYTLEPRDVARFTLYPRTGEHDVDRANERPSRADRRSVKVIDPLHRPLYILHPSLVIREYHGGVHEIVQVADLRHPDQKKVFAQKR